MLHFIAMSFDFHFEALAYALAGILFLYLTGFWLVGWLKADQTVSALWAWTPVLGLAVTVLVTANLSYLGMPVKISTPLLLLVCCVLDGWAVYRRKPHWYMDQQEWLGLAIAAAGTFLFVLPYVVFGVYHYFADAITYASIADFLRDKSYFDSPEPAHLYPWLSQMLLYRVGHFRIGSPLYMSAMETVLGINGFAGFVPATATFVFASMCGLWLLLRRFLNSLRIAQLVAHASYCFNVTLVYWPAVSNFMAQAASFGLVYALQVEGVEMDSGSRRMNVLSAGVLIGALISVYPEILPLALAPIFLYHLYAVIRRPIFLREFGIRWCLSLLVAMLVNPYTWTYAAKSVMAELQGRPGFRFLPPSPDYLEYFYGLGDPTGILRRLEWVPVLVGLVLAAITVMGVRRIEGKLRAFVCISLLFYGSMALYEKEVLQYDYGFLKALVFMSFLIPIGVGSGMGYLLSLPRKSALGALGRTTGTAWAGLLCIVMGLFEITAYGMYPLPWYPRHRSARGSMEEFFGLSSVSGVPKPNEKTLIVVPDEALDKWVSYFFRKPVGDLLPGSYFAVINSPITDFSQYRYVIGQTDATAWADEDKIIFQNRDFTFSRIQPFILAGRNGWYGLEVSSDRTAEWMGKRGEMIAYLPKAGTIRLQAIIHLTPDLRKKHLNLFVGGKEVGSYFVDHEPFLLETGDVSLAAGLNTLVFETDEAPARYGADPRLLNLLWEPLRIVRGAPSFISADNPRQAGYLEGLSGGWVSDAGLRVRFARPETGESVLKIHGDLWNIKGLVPERLKITADGKELPDVVINKSGVFVVSVPVRVVKGSELFEVRIVPQNTFCPKELGMNNDPRHLAFGGVELELTQ